jgi:hypothetical protein
MKNDISCVFEGIDNNGAIYISGIHAAEDIDILKGTPLFTQINTSKQY